MNKRLGMVIVLLFLCVALLSAENVIWGSNYEPGNVVAGVDLGFEVGPDIEISAYPSVEMVLFKPDLGELKFLDFGAKAYGRVGIPFLYPGFDLGIGLAGTAHMGFKDMDIPEMSEYLDPLDYFLELGVCFDILRTSSFPVGLILNTGLNYWLSDSVGVGFKYTSWNDYDGGSIALLIKFGDQDAAEKAAKETLSE